MNPLLLRRIRGPVFLLCFAFTAILWQWYGFSFARSWPLYLIAAGLLRLGEASLPWGAALQAPYGAPLVRRASVTGALAELLVGVVALLLTTGAIPLASFWRVYGRWWPLLLILLGVFLLIERLFDRNGSRRSPVGGGYRRTRRGGLVPLVLFLAVLGLAGDSTRFFGFHGSPWNLGWNWDFDGETHENTVTLSQPIARDGTLTVTNSRGDVEIAPSSDGRIHVTAVQAVHGPDRGKERLFAATRPSLQGNGTAATLSVPGRNGVEVKLVVQVPATVACTVRTHHGDIAVSGLQRALLVEEDHGDVALDGIGGPVQLHMDHGDVRARSLGADLAIDGRANDVTLSGVHGAARLQGEFFGATEIEGAGGPVSFHSNRTGFDLPRLGGSLSLDGENLRIDGAPEGLRLKTRSKELQVTALSGPATLEDSNSDMLVSLAEPLGPVSLADNTGNISLTLPSGANCAIAGSAGENDAIQTDFPLAQATAGGVQTIHGQIGEGGPLLELKAEHGDLTLRRGAPTGKTPERRLRSKGEPPAPVAQ